MKEWKSLLFVLFAFVAGCTFLEDTHLKFVHAPDAPNSVNVVTSIYVSVSNGNDAYPGTNKLLPVKSIGVAITNAATYGTSNILVTAGIYTPGNGLASSGSGISFVSGLSVVGGYDEGFNSNQNQYSELQGNGSLFHLISANSVSNIRIEGFVMRGGEANGAGIDAKAGGILLYQVSNVLITNCVLSNNHSTVAGGAVLVETAADVRMNSLSAISNRSEGTGGGIFITNSSNITLFGSAIGNKSLGNGGGISMIGCAGLSLQVAVHTNTARQYGGGIYYMNITNAMIMNSVISSNYCSNYGGGICGNILTNSTISNNWMFNNQTIDRGGGLYIEQAGANVLTGNIISNNTAVNFGGGVMVTKFKGSIYNETIVNNRATTGNGGGIYIYLLSDVYVSNVIINNNGGVWAGASFTDNSVVRMYNSWICGNTSNAIVLGTITNVTLSGVVMTNNSGPVTLDLYKMTFADDITITNCRFGGLTNTTGTAINEEVDNTYNHVIVGNIFYTNTLKNLYSTNMAPPNVFSVITNDSTWTNINVTNYTGAAVQYGNTAQ